MSFLQYQNLRIQGHHCILIENYVPPNHRDYNAQGPFSILINIDGTEPLLYVPTWLQCFYGSPIHLNQPAPDYLASKWKWACWILKDYSYERFVERYSENALMELVDNYFRNYPSRAR
jgi:hypothetical protein